MSEDVRVQSHFKIRYSFPFKVGSHTVHSGQVVYINDSSLFTKESDPQDTQMHTDVPIRLYTNTISSDDSHVLIGHTALFGGDLFAHIQPARSPLRFAHADGLPIYRDLGNAQGCEPYERQYPDSTIIVERGTCTFLEKLLHAREASAAGVLIISDDDFAVNPTANPDELKAAGDLSDVVLVLLPKQAGHALIEMMDRAEPGSIQVMMAVEYTSQTSPHDHIPPNEDPSRILHINGYPLINTKILV